MRPHIPYGWLGHAVDFPVAPEWIGVLLADWPHRWVCPSTEHREHHIVARDAEWLELAVEQHERAAHGIRRGPR